MKVQLSTLVEDPQVRQALLDLLYGVNDVAKFVFAAEGLPVTGTPGAGEVQLVPDGAAICFRLDPSPGAAVYLFDGSTWTAVV